jgi:hypothetical protein
MSIYELQTWLTTNTTTFSGDKREYKIVARGVGPLLKKNINIGEETTRKAYI